MNSVKLSTILSLIICSFCFSAKAQDGNPLSQTNFKSQITKDVASSIADPLKVKRVITKFINTSSSPLACKMAIFPIFDIIRNLQGNMVDFREQAQKAIAAGGNSKEWGAAEQKALLEQGDVFAAKLKIADMFCEKNKIKISEIQTLNG